MAMNKLGLLISLSLLLIAIGLFGQVSEESSSMSQGIENAVVLELPEAEDRLVEKLWKSYIRQFKGRTRKIKRSPVWWTEAANLASVSAENLDFYSKVVQRGSTVLLYWWIELDEENYLSSGAQPEQYEEVENILLHFSQQVKREYIRLELLDEEKKLKRLQVALRKLERARETYLREIEQAKAKILKAEENILLNDDEQKKAQEMILQQREVIAEVRERLNNS